MKIQITDWRDGRVIFEHDCESVRDAVQIAHKQGVALRYANLSRANLSRANLSGAYLSEANLSRANLSEANLSEANLSRANLSRAYLSEANLSRANLSRAYLSRAYLSEANLSGAHGFHRDIVTPLRILLDQPGKIRAYKLVTADGVGPFNGGIKYEVGQDYEVEANTSEDQPCGAGINLATMDWILREWQEGYRILIAEFEAKDIAAIPVATDGKFRVHRCKIIGEKSLAEIWWPVKTEVKA